MTLEKSSAARVLDTDQATSRTESGTFETVSRTLEQTGVRPLPPPALRARTSMPPREQFAGEDTGVHARLPALPKTLPPLRTQKRPAIVPVVQVDDDADERAWQAMYDQAQAAAEAEEWEWRTLRARAEAAQRSAEEREWADLLAKAQSRYMNEVHARAHKALSAWP
jgi:hypothetical protein